MFRNRKGFTLIELLIVVVIIGILAAIALPKFGSTREQAYESAMKSDLRNLQTAQEMLYNTGSTTGDGTGCTDIGPYAYKTGVTLTHDAAAPDCDLNFQPSSGVDIVLAAATNGYTATATHDARAGYQCAVTVSDEATSQSISCGAAGT
jgi:prepilin-type N-terminal cleavage/methylation domain-containing protein